MKIIYNEIPIPEDVVKNNRLIDKILSIIKPIASTSTIVFTFDKTTFPCVYFKTKDYDSQALKINIKKQEIFSIMFGKVHERKKEEEIPYVINKIIIKDIDYNLIFKISIESKAPIDIIIKD